MECEDKMERVCGYLRLIERTRLLRNTTAELEELVGFSIGDNGLARKGGKSLFMKDAIFRELAHLAKEESYLDLQEVIDAYVEADRVWERIGKINDADLVCQHLIWHFYADEDVSGLVADMADMVEGKHVPILVLMLQKALPRLSAKDGDVKDIAGDYRRVLSLLTKTVCRNITLQKLPVLTQMEDEVRVGIANPSKQGMLNRFHLIYMTNLILNSYGSLSTLQRIGISNQELSENQFFPDVEGFWTEDDCSTVFWRFDSIANGHYLFRYSLNSSRETLEYIKYFVKFYHTEEDGVMALVMHPHAIRYIVSGSPIPNNLFAYLDCTIQGECLCFAPHKGDSKWLRLRELHRGENAERLGRLLEDSRYTKTDLFADDDYYIALSLAAITSDYIYIEKEEAMFYKVPKSLNPMLENVTFKSTAGMLIFMKKCQDLPDTFIAFDDYNLFYDVSTEQAMNALGISFCTRID